VRGVRVTDPVVLVVEDNERSLKLACDVLALRGYTTLAASTGADAVDLATTHVPGIVLLDISLPDMDGVATLAKLRADPRTADIPVVAVTAFAMKGDRERLLGEGFNGYVSKPIDVTTFVDDVMSCLGAAGTSP